jgi:hypothetical protein
MKESWHISKSIPIGFIIAVLAQTVAIIWGAAKLDSRVEGIENWVKTNADTQINLVIHEQMITDHEKRISRIEKHGR